MKSETSTPLIVYAYLDASHGSHASTRNSTWPWPGFGERPATVRFPHGSHSISSVSWLAVSDQLALYSTSAYGWPWLSWWYPAAPLTSSTTTTGQYPAGTARSDGKTSTVAETLQIGARSRIACF